MKHVMSVAGVVAVLGFLAVVKGVTGSPAEGSPIARRRPANRPTRTECKNEAGSSILWESTREMGMPMWSLRGPRGNGFGYAGRGNYQSVFSIHRGLDENS